MQARPTWRKLYYFRVLVSLFLSTRALCHNSRGFAFAGSSAAHTVPDKRIESDLFLLHPIDYANQSKSSSASIYTACEKVITFLSIIGPLLVVDLIIRWSWDHRNCRRNLMGRRSVNNVISDTSTVMLIVKRTGHWWQCIRLVTVKWAYPPPPALCRHNINDNTRNLLCWWPNREGKNTMIKQTHVLYTSVSVQQVPPRATWSFNGWWFRVRPWPKPLKKSSSEKIAIKGTVFVKTRLAQQIGTYAVCIYLVSI